MAALYATVDLLTDKFNVEELVRLTGGPANGGTESDLVMDRLQAAIDEAQRHIDAYIEQRVDLPIAEEDIPQSLRFHACNIVYYTLHRNPTDGAEQRFKSTQRFLEQVQAGRLSLGLQDNDEPTPTQDSVSVTGSRPGHQRFYRDDQ